MGCIYCTILLPQLYSIQLERLDTLTKYVPKYYTKISVNTVNAYLQSQFIECQETAEALVGYSIIIHLEHTGKARILNRINMKDL